MTSETDEQFVERISREVYPGFDGWRTVSMMDHSLDRLFALARRGAAVQWRPIKEAPKDGSRILLRIGNLVGSGRFGHPHAWGITDNDGFYCDGADLPSGATHWMPLPPPPSRRDQR